MAKAAGVSRSTVQRIWDAHSLQAHRITTFKLSKDPAFVEKLTDVVGLYLNPPNKAVALCVDEKHKKFRKWLAARPRFKLHFTPTSGSWLNLVENWFSKLTQQRLRRDVLCSVQELAGHTKRKRC